jgi:hypothetical protein
LEGLEAVLLAYLAKVQRTEGLAGKHGNTRVAPPLKLKHETEPPCCTTSVNPLHPANDKPYDHSTSTSRGSHRGRGTPAVPRCSSRSSLPPLQPPIPAGVVCIKPGELVKLGIDMDIFVALPVTIQCKQLVAQVCPSQQPAQTTIMPQGVLGPA